MSDGNLYLGFDFSTQQLKVIAIRESLEIFCEESIQFDGDIPEYKTQGGVHRYPYEPLKVTAPPLMWVSALDLILKKLKASKFPFERVASISGAGQQHGSIYWSVGGVESLKTLDPALPLRDNLRTAFAIESSPVWMDSSTAVECRNLEESVAGPLTLSAITGSRGYERFTGNQISKILKGTSNKIARISLVSSFAASLLIGSVAPIDLSDGSGMNLLNIKSKLWEECLLVASGGEKLAEMLGPPIPTNSIIGELHPYYQVRYGFSKKCRVVSFTGDNPSSLAGLPAHPGDIVISLGTSDTLFLSLSEHVPSLMGHVFVSPLDPSNYMGLLCYKNGSLARERVRDICAEGSWDKFNSLLEKTPPGNNGVIGMYFFDAEITPDIQGLHLFDSNSNPITEIAHEQQVRAILEGQIIAKLLHSSSLGYTTGPSSRVLATGGASNNPHILQLIADIFNCSVYIVDSTSNSACLGAAIRAIFSTNVIPDTTYPELVERAVKCSFATEPRSELVSLYRNMLLRYKQLEESILAAKS
ncbi:Xylulose kinase isoform X1 [Oopsacas minuta]|uniref:Xylulose kinase n=1 Tax=Oopsacas minuta TaxID=111878 RepID=A0AAV7K3V0_9METZ|nr:Xylulose kinase isoform X1 [Oopsacas minuta]